MSDEILFSEETEVSVRHYTFRVYSIETHWKGDSCGKMEDMPGDFLNQEVSLIGCENPTSLEAIAAENNLRLTREHELKKETTSEPEGYAKLKHDQLVKDIRTNSERYIQRIRGAVKRFL